MIHWQAGIWGIEQSRVGKLVTVMPRVISCGLAEFRAGRSRRPQSLLAAACINNNSSSRRAGITDMPQIQVNMMVIIPVIMMALAKIMLPLAACQRFGA